MMNVPIAITVNVSRSSLVIREPAFMPPPLHSFVAPMSISVCMSRASSHFSPVLRHHSGVAVMCSNSARNNYTTSGLSCECGISANLPSVTVAPTHAILSGVDKMNVCGCSATHSSVATTMLTHSPSITSPYTLLMVRSILSNRRRYRCSLFAMRLLHR